MTTPQRYTVTAALPYANGPLHIGHMAGAYLPADTFVRYLRLRRRDVIFVCGSDEHGAAITLRARKEGTTPREIVDKYHVALRDAFQRFGIAFDIYHRTSEPIHHQTSQEIFSRLYAQGEFVEKTTEQYFDESFQQFLADRYITGTCPRCGNEHAYGDQCEKCGTSLSPTDLINPRSILSGAEPVLRQTKHWYLPLDKYQPWVEKWLLEGKEGLWKNNVYGQCKSWLQAGLQPRAMTRDLDWGVDVPLDDAAGKKLYVWLDAPIGYISATRQLFQELATGEQSFSTPQRHFENPQAEDWKRYWQDENSHLIHFIGKDNIVFHCIIFPCILHAHGEYILPENVPANEFLNLEGDKLSTSRNWAVWLHEYMDDFPGKEDVLRYVLLSIAPEQKDSEFTWKDFQARNNGELANILGNLVNRMKLLHKFYGGLVPQPEALEQDQLAMDTRAQIRVQTGLIAEFIERYRFRDALAEYINLARVANKYLTDEEPWKKWDSDPGRVSRVLYVCVQIIAALGVLGKIFLPHSAARILGMLNLPQDADWDFLHRDELVSPGQPTQGPEPLFPRIEDAVIQTQLEKLEANRKAREAAAETGTATVVQPQKEAVSFDDFQQMDLRVGTILEAAKVKGADKLLQFKVDTGIDLRTIVSGVAAHFEPESLIGKQVTVLVNLAPRKIRGVESQGMILYAEDSEGRLHIVGPEYPVMKGSVIK